MNLPICDYIITYNNKDITTDITQYVTGITYTDKTTGHSDELEIEVEDSDSRWQNAWYPQKKAQLQLIIRLNGQQMNCGTFEIDELESKGSNDGETFTIKALGAGISKPMRTKKSYVHEDKTLREIANTVASNLGLTLFGTINNIAIHRCHQYHETDLNFLNRIGGEYGYIFSVRGSQLVFTYYQDLEVRAASLTFTKNQLISWNLKDTTNKVFKNARLRHHDPLNKVTIEYDENDDDSDGEDDSEDSDEIHTRVENKQQAEAKTKYKLFKGKTAGVGGDITVPGNLLLLAGNNVKFTDLGNFNGTYHVLESKHKISRDGSYDTSANIKRVTTT